MTDSEKVLKAVCKVTGICKTKLLSRSRLWPIVEARLLLILFLSRTGYNDQRIAWIINRDRTTVLKGRHTAEDYIIVSSSFEQKFQKVANYYETGKISNAEK